MLDTNIVIALLEGGEAVVSNLGRAPEVFISAIVLGELFFGAAKSGRPLPENDIWIAATARRHRLVLVTRDRHFHEIEGLEIADWLVAPR